MKDFRFIFLRLSLYLIAGILSAFWLKVESAFLLILIGGLLLFYLFLFIRTRKNIFQNSSIGILSYLLIFALGFGIAHFNIPRNQPHHHIHTTVLQGTPLQAEVMEVLKPTSFFDRYIINTRSLLLNEPKAIKGKLLLNIPKDTVRHPVLKPGDIILLPFQPEPIPGPLNPYQFDYGNYMRHLKIERQQTIYPGKIIRIGERQTLYTYAQSLREEVIKNLKQYHLEEEELAVFQALILGQKRDISPQLYKSYAGAGALHILAISGLHIGIILLFLNYLLQPIGKIKHGTILKTIIVILLLWGFALLTGLNPSVVRAVGMFTFIGIGMQLNRKVSALNGLFLSLFFLLLINPYYVFQIGFQLSYLAVFSIIVFQPMIYRLLTIPLKVPDYFWKLISVSLAAQIGVLPLSIFYFHQFPGLFLLSNLFILPYLGIILGFGILILILSQIDLIPSILPEFYGVLLETMNDTVTQIAGFEQFIISGLSLSRFQLIACYAIIFGFILLLKKPNFKSLAFLLISVILLQVGSIWKALNIPENQIVIFHFTGESLIAEKNGEETMIYGKKNLQEKISDWKRESKIKQIRLHVLPEILGQEDDILLVVDTIIPLYNYKLKPNLVLLRDSPKINLERLIDSLQPQFLIADASNYKTYIRLWKSTAKAKKIPFHYTGEKGAFILNPKN